jgi:exportin-T
MTMKQCGCSEAFTETLKVFLSALSSTVHRHILHFGVRQFLHRMVVCLDDEILPFVPIGMESLLKSPDARELHDFIPLMNQLATKFKVSFVLCSTMYMNVCTNPAYSNTINPSHFHGVLKNVRH